MNLEVIEQDARLSGFTARLVDPECDVRLMRKAHELRFQVYCLEQGFLDAIDYPDGREADEHDASAIHFASGDSDGEVAGYVRLVMAGPVRGFPFQVHGLTLHEGVCLPPPQRSAEISRLMVRGTYRRQPDRSPEILCGLFRQMYAHSERHGIRYWYAAMERSLVRVLQRMLNIEFQQIGPVTDYYGPVAPYMIDLQDVAVRLRANKLHLMQGLQPA